MRVLALLFLAALAGTLVLADDDPSERKEHVSLDTLISQLEEKTMTPPIDGVPGNVYRINGGLLKFLLKQLSKHGKNLIKDTLKKLPGEILKTKVTTPAPPWEEFQHGARGDSMEY